jgi:hypothetical protein
MAYGIASRRVVSSKIMKINMISRRVTIIKKLRLG